MVLRRFQHCTGHITTGSWKGRGNQYIQFARVVYCKLPTNGKQLPAFPLEPVQGSNPGLRGGRQECYHSATVAPTSLELHHLSKYTSSHGQIQYGFEFLVYDNVCFLTICFWYQQLICFQNIIFDTAIVHRYRNWQSCFSTSWAVLFKTLCSNKGHWSVGHFKF